MPRRGILLAMLSLVPLIGFSQDLDRPGATISIETRITNLIQGGYEIGVFYNGPSNVSVGVQFAAQEVEGRAAPLLFESSSHQDLDIRLPWLLAVKGRYHLAEHKEGFYVEASLGAEQFRVRSGGETQRINNGFLLAGLGYIWHPWGRDGLYVNPNLGGIMTFFREDEQVINDVSYRLRRFFPSPAFSVGWRM